MGIGRYTFTGLINEGEGKGNPRVSSKIYAAVTQGRISFTTKRLKRFERLDSLSAEKYGDPSYWWVIAAASGIGWGLQLPPGTLVRIPTNLSQILSLTR